jgi:hypothetical protein
LLLALRMFLLASGDILLFVDCVRQCLCKFLVITAGAIALCFASFKRWPWLGATV